jgi:peptidoglycan biosynthesis protein MviN/MurJ (putative lipid II flippase)
MRTVKNDYYLMRANQRCKARRKEKIISYVKIIIVIGIALAAILLVDHYRSREYEQNMCIMYGRNADCTVKE